MMRLLKRIGFILLPFSAVITSYYLMKKQGLINLADFFKSHFMAFTLWRYSLLAGVLISWPYIVRSFAGANKQSEAWIKTMLQFRAIVLLLFAASEVLIVRNGFGSILGYLFS